MTFNKFSFQLSYPGPNSYGICGLSLPSVRHSDRGTAKTAERKGLVERSVRRKDAKSGLDPVLSLLSDLCRDPGHTSLGCLWLASCRQSVTGHGMELKLQICNPIAGGPGKAV